ncbi:MAG: queuosine precursor transporter [Bacilli bacterium]|nr:queuosine precursor transporter [Bacilli bacterium]
MNIFLGFINIVVVFSLVVLTEKIFKKEGLYVWLSLAVILANIVVSKTIDLFGFTTSLGNVFFASTFLATDIMSEKYSKEDAKKGIYLSIFSSVAFIIVIQIALSFIPNKNDVVNESMKTLFGISIRTTIASMIMFFVSNILDIYLYNKLKEKYPNKLWFRNNVATIICNCTENFFFVILAFIGIFDISVILSIAITKTILEIIIALCDTPFLYLSKKL